MDAHNLIRAGVLAQKTFNMADGFRITEVPPCTFSYRVPIDGKGGCDEVELRRIGFAGTDVTMRIGYSKTANVLLIAGAD